MACGVLLCRGGVVVDVVVAVMTYVLLYAHEGQAESSTSNKTVQRCKNTEHLMIILAIDAHPIENTIINTHKNNSDAHLFVTLFSLCNRATLILSTASVGSPREFRETLGP